MIYNIPKHKNCVNCGACCGIVPASPQEVETIKNYIKANNIEPVRKSGKIMCPFRDGKAKKCLIYPVRPIVCQLFGVTSGMDCPNGNSANIDGRKFLKKDDVLSKSMIINFIEW